MAGAAGVPGAWQDGRSAEEEGWDRVAVAGSCLVHPPHTVGSVLRRPGEQQTLRFWCRFSASASRFHFIALKNVWA